MPCVLLFLILAEFLFILPITVLTNLGRVEINIKDLKKSGALQKFNKNNIFRVGGAKRQNELKTQWR